MGRIPTGPKGKHCRDCAKADPHEDLGDNNNIYCGDHHLIYRNRPPETPACQYLVEKVCGNCTHFLGAMCGQVDFEMPEGYEDATIKPTAPAKEMCGEEYWEHKSE